MYKKICSLPLLTLLCFIVKAQITMSIQVPSDGIIQKPQLWNFLLVNSATTSVQIRIGITVTDALSNDQIINATTGNVFLQNGPTLLLAPDFSPIQYEYLSPKVTDLDPNGFLPVGQYIVCYKLYTSGHTGFEVASEECITVYVEPISPPMLSLPFNNSEEETCIPQFSWVPPAPLSMFTTLSYNFTLVELTEGQTAAEAIQQNMPVYTMSNITDVFIHYPSSHAALDTGKLYAWRVSVNNDNEYVAQTEVWTFKVASPEKDTALPEQVQYCMLTESADDQPISVIKDNLMYLKLYSWDQARTAVFSIKNESDSVLTNIPTAIVYGDNYLKISIPFLPVAEKVYSISVVDLDDRVYSLKFMTAKQ